MFSFHSYSTGIQSEILAPFLECIFIQIHSFIDSLTPKIDIHVTLIAYNILTKANSSQR